MSGSQAGLNHPEGLRYGPEHEWSSVGDDGIVTVGITDFAQNQLGDVEYVDLPTGHWPQFSRPADLARILLLAIPQR